MNFLFRFALIPALLGVTCLAHAETKPVEAPVVPAPRSVFDYDLTPGKDPFFPKSMRLKLVIIKPNAPAVPQPPPPPAVPDEIKLNGYNQLRNTRLAIINNRTVAQGEDFTVKVDNKVFQVRCVEIRDKSVIVEVGGATKELKLRTGL